MIHGMPGPGGSLGQCVVCGNSFVLESLGLDPVSMIVIDGIEGDLCLHQKCLKRLREVEGTGWENIPEGPLRKVYAEAAAAMAEGEE